MLHLANFLKWYKKGWPATKSQVVKTFKLNGTTEKKSFAEGIQSKGERPTGPISLREDMLKLFMRDTWVLKAAGAEREKYSFGLACLKVLLT